MTDRTMSIKSSSEAVSRRAWAVFCCVTAFYFYELVLRMTPSVMTSDLMATFGVNFLHSITMPILRYKSHVVY